MQQFRPCCDILNWLLSEFPNNKTAKHILSRAIKRVAEQEQGRYKFGKMHTQASNTPPTYLDHATYVGPVSIKATVFRGRGLFTTREVKAGDLLMVEKAFAFAYASDNESKKRIFLVINPETKRMTMGAQAELLEIMIQKL